MRFVLRYCANEGTGQTMPPPSDCTWILCVLLVLQERTVHPVLSNGRTYGDES